MNLEKVAGLLGGIRQVHRLHRKDSPSIALAEVFLWIAAGIDHRSELARVSGLHISEVKRLVATLTGRGGYRAGRHQASAFGLVVQRPHPHRRGQQLLLSPDGTDLVSSTFGSSAPLHQ